MSIIEVQGPTGGPNSGSMVYQDTESGKYPLIVHGARGSYPNPKQYVTLFDDFLGDLLEDGWSAAEGNDAQAIIATIQAGEVGGVVRMITGDTTTVSESAQALTHGLNWKANQGGLYMYCRFKPVTAITTAQYFVGFTDTLATTTLEQPFTLSTVTVTAVADNAVGFLYDTDATNDTWHCQGVKATVATATSNSGLPPIVDTWQDLEIEISTAGTASFYINGALVASVANAVTVTTALTPVVEAMARTTSSRTIDVDVIQVTAQRT